MTYEIKAYEIKLMECQNKRKAEKRELMGLPPLEPYYCKSFGSKNCCFRYEVLTKKFFNFSKFLIFRIFLGKNQIILTCFVVQSIGHQ